MNRPTLEVADIMRAAGNRFWEHHGSHLAWQHRKVLDAIVRCRTAALGGHRDQCVRCGHQAISYNSCRNRHCPRCQGNARSRWLAKRRAELLPVSYFHIVFTLPHELSALTLQNKRLLYDLLFRATLGRRASFLWRETGEVPKRKPSAVRHGSAEQAMRKIVCARRETPKIPARFFAMKLLEADIVRALGSAV
jgi:hypothetical protein